ncbi:hypothetical protein [Mycobacterium sp. 852013-51886_SCH5428379]|uniref:hypothetical protein n=1 Tax=Mycobacterium sp. 852013-51886_SCH5428379 TaxID=1834111 RepID=UPI000B1011AD|nr:hypothetical protein [Mycobacterium sp. 852013-51886_SCH5428379]
MNASLATGTRMAAAGFALACVLAACGGGGEESSESSSTSAAEASSETTSAAAGSGEATADEAAEQADYTSLLITAEDIDAPVEFIAEPAKLNPDGTQGAEQVFATADKAATITINIFVMDNPEQATALKAKTLEGMGTINTGTPEPAPIGSDGTVVNGTTPDGSRGSSALMFTEQNTFTTISFDSAPGDTSAPPPDFIDQIGNKQLAAIQEGLPNVPPPAP